jgi:hypothetical protein
MKGNWAYYAYTGLIISKLINKYTKWKIYMTLIRPVFAHACETYIFHSPHLLFKIKVRIKQSVDCITYRLKTIVLQNVGNFTSFHGIPEDLTHQQHCCENLESCSMK